MFVSQTLLPFNICSGMKFWLLVFIVSQQIPICNCPIFPAKIYCAISIFSSKFTFKRKLFHWTRTQVFQNAEIGLIDETFAVSTFFKQCFFHKMKRLWQKRSLLFKSFQPKNLIGSNFSLRKTKSATQVQQFFLTVFESFLPESLHFLPHGFFQRNLILPNLRVNFPLNLSQICPLLLKRRGDITGSSRKHSTFQMWKSSK